MRRAAQTMPPMPDTTKPWEANYSTTPQPAAPAAKDAGTDPWKQDYGPDAANAPAAPRGLKGIARDVAATALDSAISVPESLVGLADIPTGGRVGKFLENQGGAVGFRPAQAHQAVAGIYSDATQEAQRKFQAADGVVDKAVTAVQNPSLILTGIGQSLGPMGLGGVVGRGLLAAVPRLAKAGEAGAAIAGAAGEGITSAGSSAEQIRQETKDGLLTPGQAAAAAGAGAATAAFGAVGGKVHHALGLGDTQTMLAQGEKGMARTAAATQNAVNPLIQQQAVKSIPRQVIEGAIAEGFLEELPQSISEQVFQNLALGDPWYKDVDTNAIMGTISGGVMGGAAAGYHGIRRPATADGAGKGQDGQKPQDAGQQGQQAEQDQQVSPGLEQVRQAYADQLQALQQQEQGEPDVQQSTPPDGAAVLARQQAVAEAQRQQQLAASRSVESPDDEILQSTGAAVRPSQAMGIDPAAGPLSTGAAIAVDSGVHAQMQQAAQLDQQAQQQAAAAKQRAATKPQNTTPPDLSTWSDAQLSSAFKSAQDRSVRLGLARELGQRRKAQREAENQAQAQQQAPALPQPGTIPAPVNTPEGGMNGSQAPQAQQAVAQPTQAGTQEGGAAGPGAAPGTGTNPRRRRAVQTSGLTDGGTETENHGAQAAQAPIPQGKTQGGTSAAAGAGTGRLGSAGAAWARMPAAERQGAAARANLKPVIQKNIHRAKWEDLNLDVKRKLADAIEPVPTATASTSPAPAADAIPVPDDFITNEAWWKGLAPNARRAVQTAAKVRTNPLHAWQHMDADMRAKLLAAGLQLSRKPGGAEVPARESEAANAQSIAEAAHQAATSPTNDLAAPTEAQKDAGNYKKGHIAINGLDISIENPAGTSRRPEWPPLAHHYGYLKGTIGADKDHVDVFLTDRAGDASLPVFVIDQVHKDGSFDEHKVILGAADEAEARAVYLANYAKGWTGLGAITRMGLDEFKAWVNDPAMTKKPAGKLPAAGAAEDQNPIKKDQAGAPPAPAAQSHRKTENAAESSAGAGSQSQPKTEAASSEASPTDKLAAQEDARFAGNKLFTADKVAAARERMRAKLGRLNSGIDPELLVDGMTIAGAYIESGIRNFTQYAKAMIEDMGEGVKPYLLSFWEGARNYPGLDTQGMTSPSESARQHQALLTPEVRAAAPAEIGQEVEKPAKRARKTGAKADMTLTQDWGVEQINGYGDTELETGDTTKDAFLKDARQYLAAVADQLTAAGFEPHLGRNGKAEKAVSINEGAIAGSGDVTLTLHHPESGTNLYIHVGETALRGMFQSTPSGIAVMARVSTAANDRYATKGQNQWLPVDLSAADLASLVLKRATGNMTVQSSTSAPKESSNGNPEQAGRAADQGRAPEVPGQRGDAAQPGAAPADSGHLEGQQPADVSAPADTGRARRDGLRRPAADVGRAGNADEGRDAGDGRPGAGRAEQLDARAGSRAGGPDGLTQAAQAAGLEILHPDLATERKFKVQLPGYQFANATLTKDGDNWVLTSRGMENAATGTLADMLERAKTVLEAQREGGPAALPKNPEDMSPANPGPGNFHIDNPLEIVGGGPVARFDKNRAAIELLNKIREEGRKATAEEQRTLAGYTGWGSFGQELFQGTWEKPMPKPGWEERDGWLRDHLGQDEWESAQRSITNAHYTDPPTVMAMWGMADRMGFKGGRILEPSMGIGNFFGMMPAEIKARSQLAGIELDSLTGAMAQLLYPDANVKVMGYQESKTPDNFYDLVIGNWPFENTVIADRRYNTLSPFLHDYFFLKALDQVRPGGLVVGITSNGTLDKKATKIRAALARKAELVTAIRLPSGAFQEYAGTKVVTDIVILKKREQPLAVTPNDPWIQSVAYKTPAGPEVFINEFYTHNPGNVIGTTDWGHGTTRMQPGMIVHRPDNMAERLRDAVKLVPEGVFAPKSQGEHITYITNHTADREGSLTEQNGQLFVVRGEHLAPAQQVQKFELKSEKATQERAAQLRSLIDMRRKYAALIEAERTGEESGQRKALRDAFEAFEAEHGNLEDSFGLSYLRKIDDPFYPALAALKYKGRPADILSRSTTRGAKAFQNPSPQDAYVLARNKSVQPTLGEIAAIAGKPEDEVRRALVESGAVFVAPTGEIVPSDIYLSGNVREKLREALAALEGGDKAMERNVAELKKVIPPDVLYFNIESQLGATWVPSKVYGEYVAHMLNRPSPDGIEVTFINGRWKVRLPDGANNAAEARTGFGTAEYPFSKLVNAAFTNQTVTIRRKDSDGSEYVDQAATEEANSRIGEIRSRFAEWLWSDPERRQALEQEYNESRNAFATPHYDGSFLGFEGMALSLGRKPFNLRQHQVNAIWRAIVNRRSINAHEVGTGKTFTMGGIAVESRRYGIAKKPVILAHNANSASVAAEIQMMYPAAKVLYVDNLSADTIAIRMRQIANDDWDAVVLPHSLIDRLAFREDTLMAMAKDDIRSLEEEAYAAAEEDGVDLTADMLDDEDELKKLRSVTAKELVKARNRIIETIKRQAQRSSREGAIPFEDLGIDMVLVDEAHEFKKPPISTRMNMKGLNTQTSDRSIALQFITRYVRNNNFGGNVHTFTGTPITNTLTEIFHQMRYVMEDEMRAAGVDTWDGWFGSFAKEVQDVELSAAGEYEAINRLAGFINVPELRRMIGQYMDVVFADDMPEMQPRKIDGKTLTSPDITEAERAQLLNGRTEGASDRPYKKVINVTSDLTPQQSAIFAQLQGYARAWRAMRGKERMEVMRNGGPESPIITEGLANKASFDVRLTEDERWAGQEGQAPDDPGSKASKAVANVLEVYNSDPRAAQVIFSDVGYSTSQKRSIGRNAAGDKVYKTVRTFSTMRDVLERLVQGGIPREQIAIVDGSTSKEKRKEIADAMNELRIRVVIGSTDTLGVGVNMQGNLRAMHHMDAPYMPGELEQRNGRGLRQGNQWNTVLEYRYMTDRLDGRRWQILAIKQRFITAFMKANSDTRVIEGDAASDEESDILQSFSEAAGDPRILIRAKLRKNVETLQRAERIHSNGVADARRNLAGAQRAIEFNLGTIKAMQAGNLPQRLADVMAAQSDDFRMTVRGQEFDNRKDAEAAIASFLKGEVRMGQSDIDVGDYRGLPVKAEWHSMSVEPDLVVKVGGQEFSSSSLRGLEQLIRNYPARIQRVEDSIAKTQASMGRLEEVAKAPFARATDLEQAQKRLADLEKDIEVNPVPPPAWLRAGAPLDSQAYRDGQPFVVTGHRWTDQGWFVLGQDAKGDMAVPYLEVTDDKGMSLYEERPFQKPVVIAKDEAAAAATQSAAEPGQAEADTGEGEGEGTAFRRSPATNFSPAARMEAVRAVEKTAAAISRAWANGPEVVVAFDMNDPVVPDSVRRADLKQRSGGAQGTPNGFWHKGKVYLMASQLRTPNDAARVLFHEALGHHGLRGLFGKELGQILNQVATMRKADVDAKIREYGLKGVNKLDRRAAAEEVLAEMAEKTPQLHFVRRAVAAIRTWLRQNVPGFKTLALSDDELIRSYILPARAWVEQGGPQDGGPRGGLSFSRADESTAQRAERNTMADLARNDNPFALPSSSATTVEQISADIDPALKVAPDPGQKKRYRIEQVRDSALTQIQQSLSHPGKVSIWDKTVGTMRHLAERNPAFKPVFDSAQRFLDDVSMLANDAADFAPRLLPRVESWRDLTKKPITAQDNKAIARPLFEGTLMWTRDEHGEPVLVDDLAEKYRHLLPDEQAQLLLAAGRIEPRVLQMWRGLPLDQYAATVNSSFTNKMLRPGIVWSVQELKARFGLSDEQVSLYQEARKAIDRSIDMTARTDMLRAAGTDFAHLRDEVLAQDSLVAGMTVLTRALQDYTNARPGDKDAADLAFQLHNQIVNRYDKAKQLMAEGYAPLSRFGRYTVDVVDPAGERQYFGMFESMREANQMALRMRDVFKGATVTQGTMSEEAYKLFAGITPESLEQFGEMLGLGNSGNDAQDKTFQAYLQLAKNNHSALKRLIHRKGIAGYSEDVGRVLASFVYSNARLGSGGLNAGTMDKAINAIPKEQGELKDVAMGLRDYIQNPQEEGQAVRGMLFAQYLGGSVASALVNMTQPFQITMPWLSRFGGMRKAAGQMARAVNDMRRAWMEPSFRYEKDLADALHHAEADGVVSPQEIHQLMAQARGTGSLRVGDGTRAGEARAKAHNAWERVKVAWGQPFALAEQFNRRSTFIAAYRTAREHGMANPAEFARQAVLETQFLYNKANKPAWARGAIGGTLFTFKTYSVSYLELMNRMWTQGGPEGKRAVAWAVAMLLLMGGAGGLPFMEDAEDLIDGAGQMMGYNLSSKQWRKELLADVMGKELADFIEQGVSGLPGAPVDISGRLGMGNLIPGTGLLLTKRDHTQDLLEVVGPAGDLAKRAFAGAGKLLSGDPLGAAAQFAPTAVTNLAKGADMASSGMYKDARGYKVIDTTLDEALAKAIGFQPHSVAAVQEGNSFMMRSKAFYLQTSAEIKAQWADALFRQDAADLARVKERLAAWNRDNPEQPIVVKMPDIWKRVREMGKPRTERIADSAPKALRQEMKTTAQQLND